MRAMKRSIIAICGCLSFTAVQAQTPADSAAYMRIEDAGHRALDSVTLRYPNESVVLFATTHDSNGIFFVSERCNWTVTGTLHPIVKPDNTSRVYYDASAIVTDEKGYIIARTVDGKYADSVWVQLVVPSAVMLSPVTRDMNGDGYLDVFELHFTRPVSLTNADTANVHLKYGNTFVNDSLVSCSGNASDSVYYLYVREDSTFINGVLAPQTGWQPDVAVSLAGIDTFGFDTHARAIDGAGPVIWRVITTVADINDRTKDKVEVIFSEKVTDSTGTSLRLNIPPEKIFQVWRRENNMFVFNTTILDSIRSLALVQNDSIITFNMTNGAYLTQQYYFSINTAYDIIADKNGLNEPTSVNRKVMVVIQGLIPQSVINPVEPAQPVTIDNPAPPSRCGCGTGTGLALIPPIGFRIGSSIRKRRKVNG